MKKNIVPLPELKKIEKSSSQSVVDTLYDTPQDKIPEFTFNASVAQVFDNMAARSIPGYLELQACSFHIAERFLIPETGCYDLGCSTGNTLISIAPIVIERAARLCATDYSEEMIKRAKEKTASTYVQYPIEWKVENLERTTIEDASLIFMHYVLQFTDPKSRKAILQRIYDGLHPEGALFLSEKVLLQHHDAAFVGSLYYGFKRRNGYSITEITQKKKALEGVLRPSPIHDILSLLSEVGFTEPVVVLQNYQFVSILAVKR